MGLLHFTGARWEDGVHIKATAIQPQSRKISADARDTTYSRLVSLVRCLGICDHSHVRPQLEGLASGFEQLGGLPRLHLAAEGGCRGEQRVVQLQTAPRQPRFYRNAIHNLMLLDWTRCRRQAAVVVMSDYLPLHLCCRNG